LKLFLVRFEFQTAKHPKKTEAQVKIPIYSDISECSQHTTVSDGEQSCDFQAVNCYLITSPTIIFENVITKRLISFNSFYVISAREEKQQIAFTERD
jgi:hypothetical protein